MKFETEHGCVVSEMATAYGNSKQIGRYAIAAAMNEVLTQAERVDQMEIRVCAPLEEKKTHLYDVKAEAARCAREHGQTFWEPEIIRAAWAACTFVQVNALAADVKQQAWNKETVRTLSLQNGLAWRELFVSWMKKEENLESVFPELFCIR